MTNPDKENGEESVKVVLVRKYALNATRPLAIDGCCCLAKMYVKVHACFVSCKIFLQSFAKQQQSRLLSAKSG